MRIRGSQLLLPAGDLLLVGISILCAMMLRFEGEAFATPWGLISQFTGATTFAFVLPPVLFYLAELYSPTADFRRRQHFLRLFKTLLFSLLLLIALYYWLPDWRMVRGALLYHALSFVPLILLWRYLYSLLQARWHGLRPALILGTDDEALEISALLQDDPSAGYEIRGFLGVGEVPPDDAEALPRPYLGSLRAAPALVEEQEIAALVVAEQKLSAPALEALLNFKLAGVQILEAAELYKTVAQKLSIRQLDSSWLMSEEGFRLVRSTTTRRLQRIMDIGLAVVSLVLLAPLCLLVSMAVAISMGFPVLFRQQRVGHQESSFVLYKFRSMRRDAEQETGPIWSTGPEDPRVSRLGRVLRRTRIDEIPQLYNVLRGDMSLVGPRPERPHFVAELKDEIPQYRLRFVVKPGLTGWGQINYRYGATADDAVEKLRYDLFYIQEMSVGMNIQILMRTLQTILFHPGS